MRHLAILITIHTYALLWITRVSYSREVIKIGFIPALSPKNSPRTTSKYIYGAFLVAIRKINQEEIIPGYELVPSICDNRADTVESIQCMIRQKAEGVRAFIGPEDTCRSESHYAAAMGLPIISFKCGEDVSKSSGGYPNTYARTLPDTTKILDPISTLLEAYRWKRFSLIYGDASPWQEIVSQFKQMVQTGSKDIVINHEKSFAEPYAAKDQMPKIVLETYKDTRVYVFLGDDAALRDFLRYLQLKYNENGEYAVIAVQEKPYNPEEREKLFKHYLERELKKEFVQAFQAVLLLCPRAPIQTDAYKLFLNHTVELSSEPPLNIPKLPKFLNKVPVPLYGPYLYDAVMLYAKALRDVLSEGYNISDGAAIVNKIRNHKYTSIQGYDMFIDDKGDSESNYTVLALQDNEDSQFGKTMIPVGQFIRYPNLSLGFEQELELQWIGGMAPVDRPACGYRGEKCQYKPNLTAVITCLVIATLVIIATVFGCRHYIYEQKLSSLLWKIDYRDLLVTDPDVDPALSGKAKRKAAPSSLSFLGLDEVMSRSDRANRHPNITIASYKGQLVAVKSLKRKHVELTRNIKKELQLLKEMQHDNINHFIGASLDPPNLCLVYQYASRGSLQDILDNEDLHLDDMFIASLVFDLIKGMIFLHDSEIGSHGNLKPSNCLVDSRWVLQIADFGLHPLKQPDISLIDDEEKQCQGLLWRSPELLRQESPPARGTPKGDVYSFALILFQIHSRTGPWGSTTLSAKEIVDRVKYPLTDCAFRPHTSQLRNCHECVIKCMTECWQEEPDIRPDCKYIRVRLKPMQRGMKSNIFDNMLAMMEKYANNLEAIVEERTDLLVEEKKKTEALLLRMLPPSVADQLKRGCPVIPESYENVSIYFSDIVGFTSISAESNPMQVVDLLNDLYTTFDSIIGEYDVYKIETIGDAYMVVSGLPIRNGNNHAGEVASMSLHLLNTIKNFTIRHRPSDTLKLRIGIHSGPCVTGVVGMKMPRYCLFGDTVNTASRMESTGVPLKIHCSKECRDILNLLGGYILEDRGIISMKGKGDRYTYFVTGEEKSHRLRRLQRAKAMHYRLEPASIPRVESGSSWSEELRADKVDISDVREPPSRNGSLANKERTYLEHEV